MALAWENLSAIARSPHAIKQHRSDRLWRIFGPLLEARERNHPFVIAQLGQSLDGRIAAPGGHSHYINGPEALEHLHRLRALVDAVVVGASTVVLDNPSLTVRRVTGRNPARVVIDPNRRTALTSKLFTNDGTATLRAGPPGADDPHHLQSIPANAENAYPPDWLLAQLADRGLKRVLIEGGATTVSHFVASGALDRLHILTGPLIIGSGPFGLNLPEIDHLNSALRPETAAYPMASGDVLFDCRFEKQSTSTQKD